MLKTVLSILYVVVVVVMAAATIVEKYFGTDYVSLYVYGAWWFSVLWAVLTAVAVAYFVKRRVRRLSVVVLHLSFVFILAGALLTHLTAKRGVVHLRLGESVDTYLTDNASGHREAPLPFTMCLYHFEVICHEGTNAPADYESRFTITSGNVERQGVVTMNNIFTFNHVRFYQSSYDDDGLGSYLAVNSDPYGIPVTYFGYALLFIALVWMLVDPKGTYRSLLRKALLPCLLFVCGNVWAAPPTLPRETAAEFGRLNILYNDRICPLQTFALDFTKKLYGKRSYQGLTAEQVLAGFVFWGDEWSNEPLGKKQSRKQEECRQLIMLLRQGTPLKLFPFHGQWYAPTDHLPEQMETARKQYISEIFSWLNQDAHAGHFARMNETLIKMQRYQQRYGGSAIPSPFRIKAERLYNRLPFATILFMVNLTMGIVCLLLLILHRRQRWTASIMALSFLALTVCMALRWMIRGTIPLSNGYESMLFMAWSVMLVTLFMSRRHALFLVFGFLLSGFFLLVSHISQMDPQITHVMPVLNSPLLCIHVSVIMMSFALLSLTFACGVAALVVRRESFVRTTHHFSLLMLYPALTCLGIGIFVGAIWANVSWGTYWSWDPKEVWALITLMVYAVAVHRQSLPWLSRPKAYHAYCVFAFLTILMTYFGVNYFLGGMHSYA